MRVSLEDVMKCLQCGRSVRRRDTLLMFSRKVGENVRLCRDCQVGAYMDELKDGNMDLGLDVKLRVKDIFTGITKDGTDRRG